MDNDVSQSPVSSSETHNAPKIDTPKIGRANGFIVMFAIVGVTCLVLLLFKLATS